MHRLLWAALALVLTLHYPGGVRAQGQDYGEVVVAEVTSIYDGDTFRATISGWPAIIGERVPVRVNGIDTPELRGHCPEEIAQARQAKQATVALIRGAKTVELRRMRRGKYFRIVADVYLDGVSLGDLLLGRGLAKPYTGGSKATWCP